MPIQMHIDACRITHDRLNRHEILVHPVQVAFFIPYISVHFFLKGAEFLAVNSGFCLFDCRSHLGITADIYIFGVISATCKRRIYIDKVYLYTFLFEIGASRKAFATDNHIVVGILANHFLALHFVERHATHDPLDDHVVFTIAEHALCAYEVV